MYQRQVSFGEAIKKAVVENYCNFSGRASVSEYWWFALFNFLLGMVLTFVLGSGTLGTTVSGIVSLALFLPGLGLAVRRLHDIGRSGWWLFLALIPLVGAVILIIWFCKASQPEFNQYGSVPNMVE